MCSSDLCYGPRLSVKALETLKVKAHASSLALLRRLIGESVRPYARWLVAALACMSLMAGATALTAYLLDPVVNDVFIAQDRDFLWLIGGVVLGTFAVKGLAGSCGWRRGPARAVTGRSGWAHEKLSRQCRSIFQKAGVEIVHLVGTAAA